MNPDEIEDDWALAALRALPTCDVSSARARRLRADCHRLLTRHATSHHAPARDENRAWQPALRVLAGVWSVAYLLETFRLALVGYGFW
jgi:hypothetical protein